MEGRDFSPFLINLEKLVLFFNALKKRIVYHHFLGMRISIV